MNAAGAQLFESVLRRRSAYSNRGAGGRLVVLANPASRINAKIFFPAIGQPFRMSFARIQIGLPGLDFPQHGIDQPGGGPLVRLLYQFHAVVNGSMRWNAV